MRDLLCVLELLGCWLLSLGLIRLSTHLMPQPNRGPR